MLYTLEIHKQILINLAKKIRTADMAVAVLSSTSVRGRIIKLPPIPRMVVIEPVNKPMPKNFKYSINIAVFPVCILDSKMHYFLLTRSNRKSFTEEKPINLNLALSPF